MQITNQYQYNQGISRYKLLSATAGVGAVITNKFGYYVLISDVDQWPFIKKADAAIRHVKEQGDANSRRGWYEKAKKEIASKINIELVDDDRFIEFLRQDKGLADLLCLAAIPHLTLNENYNTIKTKEKASYNKLRERTVDSEIDHLTIPGTHFPKWFRNGKGQLKEYKEWKALWKSSGKRMDYFAPPRDANDPYTFNGVKKLIKLPDNRGTIEECRELTQLNLILICENGHLSDIPWSRYLKWRTDVKLTNPNDKGENIFSGGEDCCDKPNLKWSENKNRSEGYASIYIECENCGYGSGKTIRNKFYPKINLEGINNLAPHCAGHKPWEISLEDDNHRIPYDTACCKQTGERTSMQIALVTGNNVYFANTFSSVYMPVELITGISKEMIQMLDICNRRFEKVTSENKSRKDWAARKIDIELLDEEGVQTTDKALFVQQLKKLFVDEHNVYVGLEGPDLHEAYRWQEYKVFTENNNNIEEPGLFCSDITLPNELKPFFKKIKKVDELKVTSIQLDFNRIKPNERVLDTSGNILTSPSKGIFSRPSENVHILPAVENFGEGIFLQFDDQAIEGWLREKAAEIEDRISPLMPKPGNLNGNNIRKKIDHIKAKFPMIHTFSHLLMRELEFTCGYPTASLKERLYISPRMSGVLIYTAEGSEGSMGGLVWQAFPERLIMLIKSALDRALDCSSDPLCWESEGQGVFNLNLAACFSCGLVSETACEERNLILDRRLLVDDDYGFFKAL